MAKSGTTKYESNKQENRVASKLGGKTVIASGALWGSKGDVRTKNLLIECKTTAGYTFRVKAEVWEKIYHEAVKDSLRKPLLVVELQGVGEFAIFSPKDFAGFEDKVTNYVYNNVAKKGDTSFTISKNTPMPSYVVFKATSICRSREHRVVCMPLYEFTNKFEEELN